MFGLVLDSLGNSSLGLKDSEQEQRRSGSGGSYREGLTL